MWKCESCSKEYDEKTAAIEVKVGYINREDAAKSGDQYMAFKTEYSWAPLCDACAISCIKGEI
jgi:hypothetical protein